ncbi:MAG: type II methionyl aminopeptidase [DPANN group archaeon]|nr:type II methionyl aminopeptidase [DPANN group archaeon]
MEKDLADWRSAGRISARALEYGRTLIRPGAKLLDASDKIEEKIRALGGEPAFPAQISLDHNAAHYCADPDDLTIFKDQVCCLDVGAHVNGAIGDNALTVDLSGKHQDLVQAARDALDNAVAIIRPGITLGEIGKTIQETIQKAGFAPIKNLSGHGLDRYQVHTPPQIPNFDSGETATLEEGMIIAIEPFATTGRGLIKETDTANIFSMEQPRPVRNPLARKLTKELTELRGLPFTSRWLTRKYPAFKVAFALKELSQHHVIHSYPPLIEVDHGLVAQAEHSLLITEDGNEILTLS